MKICLFIISDGWGGAETVVYELARHLREKGQDVSIVINQEILKFYKDLDGVEIFNIGNVYNFKILIKSIIFSKLIINEKAKLSSFPWTILLEFLHPIYYKIIEKKLIKVISENKFDIIHSHLENADILVSSLNKVKIPKIATIHSPRAVSDASFFKNWKKKVYTNALYKMDNITFVSKWLLNEFNKDINVSNKSIVIYNGIRLTDFRGDLIPTKILNGKFNLLFPGGPKLWKGVDILIQALYIVKNKIPDIHLYITRNVPQESLLRKMVKDLELEQNVTFLGLLPLKDYRSLLNSVDILVMPSKEEAFGIVFLEAMALGKPIIAANKGGIPGFIKNKKNGFLVEPNSNQVAGAILDLYKYENHDLQKEISKNNMQDVKKFDWDKIVDQYIDLYKVTLSK